MRRLIIGLAIALTAAAVGLGAGGYTIVPWEYGAIVWVGSSPPAAHSTAEYAAEAVNDVFSFWGVFPPVPGEDWASPVQTSPQAWWQQTMKQIQSPSVPIAEFIERDHSLIRGTPIPEANSDNLLIVPAPSWEGKKIHPLIIGIYPDREEMDAACGDYSLSGLYGPPPSGRGNAARGEELPETMRAILSSHCDIIIYRAGDWKYLLYHELAHWLTDLVLLRQGGVSSLPPVLREGVADYTAHALSGEDLHWQAVAAAWAQSAGKLDDVPPPLVYNVGTSVVAYLVRQEGKQKFLSSLPTLAADWPAKAKAIAPGWRAALLTVKLTDGDRALYEAKLERLSLCAWLLDPVLPQEAKELIDRLYAGCGTTADINRFWNVIEPVPPPSPAAWEELARREDTFRLVQYRDGGQTGERMARARVEVALRKYREADDWPSYYNWFVTGLRRVIAAWGIKLKEAE